MSKSEAALERIKQMDRATITADDIAPVLGSDPQYIRMQAHTDKSGLGFPVTIVGRRVKIWRVPFIQFAEALHGASQTKTAQN